MAKIFGVIWGALAVTITAWTGVAGAEPANKPDVRNYTASGNLESTHKIGCIPLSDARPEYNPVDLYRGAKVCLDSGQLQDAFSLVSLANAYGRFDMLRVADPTAHQAVAAARMEVFADTPDAVKEQFSALAAKNMNDPAQRAELCRVVGLLGAPTYNPSYMIQHGMMAFMQRSGDGLVKDFDRDKSWSEVLTSYLKCV